MGPIKYTALKADASPRRVAAWRESVDQQVDHHDSEQSSSFPLRASRWVAPAGFLAVTSGVIAVLAGLVRLFDWADTGLITVAAVVAAIAFGTLWVILQQRVRALAEGWRDPYRLMSFAKDNGFHAAPVAGPGELPGRIFGRGLDEHRVRLDVVAWVQGGRQCHVATECWNSGTPEDGGEPTDAGSCRYLAVRLSAEDLPHTVFEADADADSLAAWTVESATLASETADGSGTDGSGTDGSGTDGSGADASSADASGTDASGGEESPVSVQLHFDSHETSLVTTTRGTERWAKDIFTERVLRLMTHSAQPRDAEIVGRWFIAYDIKDGDPLSVSGWERTFQLVSALPAYPLVPPHEGEDLEFESVTTETPDAARSGRMKRILRLPHRAVSPARS